MDNPGKSSRVYELKLLSYEPSSQSYIDCYRPPSYLIAFIEISISSSTSSSSKRCATRHHELLYRLLAHVVDFATWSNLRRQDTGRETKGRELAKIFHEKSPESHLYLRFDDFFEPQSEIVVHSPPCACTASTSQKRHQPELSGYEYHPQTGAFRAVPIWARIFGRNLTSPCSDLELHPESYVVILPNSYRLNF